jgi:hypothetical protein
MENVEKVRRGKVRSPTPPSESNLLGWHRNALWQQGRSGGGGGGVLGVSAFVMRPIASARSNLVPHSPTAWGLIKSMVRP